MQLSTFLRKAEAVFSSHISIKNFVRRILCLMPSSLIIKIPTGKLKGLKWIVGSGINTQWMGIYELHKQDVFSRMLRSNNVVFDIGANVGFYTLLASSIVGNKGHVYAFEPSPKNIQYLDKHLKINNVSNVSIIEAACANCSGDSLFDESDARSVGHLSPKGKLRVETVSLDSLNIPKPDILKIDIEGGEIDCLKGSIRLLSEHKPIIFLATHGFDIKTKCLEILIKHNYEIYMIGKDIAELLAMPKFLKHSLRTLIPTTVLTPFPKDHITWPKSKVQKT